MLTQFTNPSNVTSLKGVALLNTLLTSKANNFVVGKEFGADVISLVSANPKLQVRR